MAAMASPTNSPPSCSPPEVTGVANAQKVLLTGFPGVAKAAVEKAARLLTKHEVSRIAHMKIKRNSPNSHAPERPQQQRSTSVLVSAKQRDDPAEDVG